MQWVPIQKSQYGSRASMSDVTHLRHHQEDEIRELLMGHSVTKLSDDNLVLDNGVTLQLVGNDGGCGCNSGCYDLTELNGVDNIITDVQFESPGIDDYDGTGGYEDVSGTYKIFVFADNQKINLAEFYGTDGNGFYGTGYHIYFRPGIIEAPSDSIQIEQ